MGKTGVNKNKMGGYLIFQIISVIDGWGIFCELALRWMSLNLTDDKSTLFQVMAWRRQATSHYLRHCWPRSPSPYGVTRPQWVNSSWASFCLLFVIGKHMKKGELPWCQLCCHWCYWKMLLWQPPLPPVMINWTSWQLLGFSVCKTWVNITNWLQFYIMYIILGYISWHMSQYRISTNSQTWLRVILNNNLVKLNW